MRERITIPMAFLAITLTTSYLLQATADSNRKVAGAFESAGNAIKDTAEKAGEGIKNTAESAGKGIAEAGTTVYEKGLKPAGEAIAHGATTAADATKQGFETAGNELKKDFETAGDKIKDAANKAATVFKDMANATQDFVVNKIYNQGLKQTVYERGLKKGLWEEGVMDTIYTKGLIGTVYKKGFTVVAGEALLLSKIAAQTFRNWFGKKMHPDFCKNVPTSLHNLPTVEDAAVKKEDKEGLIPYIIKYSPVVWLQGDEIYFPIWITEWCNGPQTSIKTQEGQVIVAPGTVTMEAAYELYRQSKLSEFTEEKKKLEDEKAKKPAEARGKEIDNRLEFLNRVINWKYSGKPVINTKAAGAKVKYDELYFDNAICTTYGSNTDLNGDGHGNLTTPCYVVTSEEKGNIYIYYTYFYGFNAPYDVGPITGDKFDMQDAHEADYEHVTLELDKNTKALKRIFFAAHGTTEGFWLDAHHPDVSYEGTHPVTFAARGSHADYPREGTYIRIFGIANDITGKGMRWTPKLVRIYPPEDPRFDPKTMGWVCFPGTMGKRGVSHPTNQGWFMNNAGGNLGRDYNSAPFCNNPTWGGGDVISRAANEAVAQVAYAACMAGKVAQAVPPSGADF